MREAQIHLKQNVSTEAQATKRKAAQVPHRMAKPGSGAKTETCGRAGWRGLETGHNFGKPGQNRS